MENKSEYKKRIADRILAERLAAKGAVLIEGPKWCGKTTTAEQQAKSIVYMSDPKKMKINLLLAENDPDLLLAGDTPRLVDEWQVALSLWDAVRFEVDQRHSTGQFILTGSSVPPDMNKTVHSGTGRISRLRMRPMSLAESGESTGAVSLERLFNISETETVYAESRLSFDDITFLICRGGWPFASCLDGKQALIQAYDYYDAVISSDMSRVDGRVRDPGKIRRLMRSYARLQGTQAGDETICADIQANETERISSPTVRSYIRALEKMFVIEDMPAWNPNIRSKTAVRTSDTRYFVDPSIAAAALGFGPGDLKEDLETCGLMFETMAVRDLRVYSEALDGSVYHYRDKNGLEADAVIHLRDGSYGLAEIKLGGDKLIDQGAASLLRLAGLIDTDKMKSPSFLMVLTAVSPAAYRRKDGVFVVPIGCLGAAEN